MWNIDLARNYYQSQRIQQLEKCAEAEFGIISWELMLRAGLAAWKVIHRTFPQTVSIKVLTGRGNNGGDGYVVAWQALQAGYPVEVYAVGPSDAAMSPLCHQACEQYQAAGGRVKKWEPHLSAEAGVLVDAILGTGLRQVPYGEAASAIAWLSQQHSPIVSLDIPSGLCADRGIPLMEPMFRAQCTITFMGYKQGFAHVESRSWTGTLYADDLNLPPEIWEQIIPDVQAIEPKGCGWTFVQRPWNAHKGQFGRVLVIGGALGMGGAVRLAAEAALRMGAGWAQVLTQSEHILPILSARPELMVHGFQNIQQAQQLLEHADVVVIGPGLGQDAWGFDLWKLVLNYAHKPMIWDADALNLWAIHRPNIQTPAHWIFTPHVGEAARLLGVSPQEIETDRFGSMRGLLHRLGESVVVLKGAGTLIATQSIPTMALNLWGNPSMAAPGMGDVLTGMIAGLVAQRISPFEAACKAVYQHACIGDELWQGLEKVPVMLAGDLCEHIQ